MSVEPYYADEHVRLFHGDFRDLMPAVLGKCEPDLVMADPPYGETSLEWDRWPDGWPSEVIGRSMWCWGSMRMFLDKRDEFGTWKLSQDVIWRKNRGNGVTTDRFLRAHETLTHWYRGPWSEVHTDVPRHHYDGPDKHVRARTAASAKWYGAIGSVGYDDDGTRMATSLLYAPNVRGGINETEKPVGILEPLIAYGCPVGGLVVDVFAGSSSSLAAARATGRRAIGFELREQQCEKAARRLRQGDLFAGLGDAS